MDVYEWADREIDTTPRYATGFTQLLATGPYLMPPAARRLYDARLPVIRSYQKTALDTFRAALRDELHPAVLHWLMNETPEGSGLRFHRSLEERHYTLPVFFRTDEVRPGRINEVQCPGSLWGELQLAYEYAIRMGFAGGEAAPADQFVAQLTGFLREAPVVDHLLDAASAPAGVRYFIEKTRPGVKYWSIDRGVKPLECNFIRHHSFANLRVDGHLHARLDRAGRGLEFDLPPYVLWDQKAPMALPFWSMTRAAFADEVRDLFPFATPLLPGGIELEDGSCAGIEDFARRPQSQRAYYLKYAGSDFTRNWGSKAVYRLSNLGSRACRDFLQQCLSGYERGEIWLLQKEEFQEDEIAYVTRDGAAHRQRLRAKFSGYYGPAGCLGVLALHRRHHKVHGQDETVMSYVRAGDP